MKPPVDSVKVSSRGREILIQSKRNTGLKQWNELLRWAFCISLSNMDPPKISRKLDSGIEPIEWATFSGPFSASLAAMFYLRAEKDGVDRADSDSVAAYFRAHIERGVGALRTAKSLSSLAVLSAQMESSKSGS
jgi:DNA sulfur modification protein DndE